MSSFAPFLSPPPFFFYRMTTANLLSLLKWKSHPDKITTTLKLIKNLPGEELVKYLQDVFDSLFAMFSTEDGNATPHSGLVFEVLVRLKCG